MPTIILDIEFTGLDNTYIGTNEIVQVKMMRLDAHPSALTEIQENFSSLGIIGIYGRLQGMPDRFEGKAFSAMGFMDMLSNLDVNQDEPIEFIGFSTTTDWQMLGKYGIKRLPHWTVTDIVDILRLSPLEQTLAEQGRSMEVCHYMLTGKPFTGDHSGLDELRAIRDMYLIAKELPQKERMEFVPFGHCAGMPLAQYVQDYRRNADGYRFNNSDQFAASMDWYIAQEEHDCGSNWPYEEDLED
jgi:hypothetical protein